MFCEMVPPVEVSAARIDESYWAMGSLMICQRLSAAFPIESIVTWKDGSNTLCLRKRTAMDPSTSDGDSQIDGVYFAGTSAAVWSIGSNAFCKVKAWREGMELESRTIAFIRERAPTVPVPEVIYTWIDRAWNRTFLILKRIPGRTLDEEWHRLTPNERIQIACRVAEYCCELALISSSRFESATGHAVVEPFLNSIADESHPSWKPRTIGPFSPEALGSHLSAIAPDFDLNIESLFYFYHADLGPTNIMILDNTISGILDLESAAYYPKFWIATKPRLSAGFYLRNDKTDQKAWSRLLGGILEAYGFPQNIDGYNMWRRSKS